MSDCIMPGPVRVGVNGQEMMIAVWPKWVFQNEEGEGDG